jgi:prepilin-type N-terminal cleavage/methylation domain-containing protein
MTYYQDKETRRHGDTENVGRGPRVLSLSSPLLVSLPIPNRASGTLVDRRRAADGGFTLFEVLIALSLSLLLLGAVYAGLSLYWRYSSAGHAEVERAQLARAVLRRIELDVRSIMYRGAPAASSQSSTSGSSASGSGSGASSGGGSSGGGSSGGSSRGGSSGGGGGGPSGSGGGGGGSSSGGGSSGGSSGSGSSNSSSSNSTSSSTSPPVDTYGTSNSGLFGTATTLMMHVSKTAREQTAATLAAAGNVQTRTSDQTTISYFVTGMATGNLQQATTGSGLARLEGDRLALSMADQQSDVGHMAAQTEILAPEVSSLRFMYYDGFAWRADWDSSVLGGLPKAIDIEMVLQPLAGTTHTGLQGATAVGPTSYRLVIALPLGKPIESSTIQPQ